MTDIKLNPLSTNQRRLLQIGAALLLVVFLLLFLVLSKKQSQNTLKNATVYLKEAKLYVFDETIPVNQYPDRIAFHYPYLVIVKPEQQKSFIYNLETKKKEKELGQLLLDYSKEDILFNQGNSTYFDKQDLGVLCEKGFIKSTSEILCITKVSKDNIENKLISIDINTKKQKELYVSKNLLTDVSVIDSSTYLGEIDLYTHKSYVLINNQRIEVPDVVSLIYQMNGKAFFAAYKSAFNNNIECYYLIDQGKVVKQESGNTVFFRWLKYKLKK